MWLFEVELKISESEKYSHDFHMSGVLSLSLFEGSDCDYHWSSLSNPSLFVL